MEIAYVTFDPSSILAQGTQIGVAYGLHYSLRDGVLDVEIVDGQSRYLSLGDADFFDLGYSPLFNSLPVHDDQLLRKDASAREYTMLWVSVPDLTIERSRQRYVPRRDRQIEFRASTYHANIEFDPDGLVQIYEGLAERIA